MSAMDVAPDSNTEHQNVGFRDGTLGTADGRGRTHDSLRDSVFLHDTPLDEFFSRPIKVWTQDWATGQSFNAQFNPWTLYWSNSAVLARISNYKLLKANLRVKFLINGNAFYYGRLLAYYTPRHNDDEFSTSRFLVQQDLIGATQKPHIYMDPTTSQGGELLLPFFTPHNVMDITKKDWDDMGEIRLRDINPLKHANGAVDTITVSAFVWAENVDYAIPTRYVPLPTEVTPQGFWANSQGAEVKGIVSKPASTVAKVAGTMTKIPVIGPYARATEIGAKAISSMAAIFGFSKPSDVAASAVTVGSRTSMALTDGCENITKLTADSKQELALSPHISGIDANDELTICGIASRECFLTKFDWKTAQPGYAPESLLWNAIVDPGLHGKYDGGQIAEEIHLTPMAFATLPFQYWKGTIKFRFQVVCSAFHKGRLKVVYDPTGPGTAVTDGEYNTAYTTIVDIADTKDFTIECGWGQSTPFREPLDPDINSEQVMYGSVRLPYSTRTSNIGNGTISVHIVNDLTSPDSVINNDVEINVFVSAADDFEVAAPTDKHVSRMRIYAPTETPPVEGTTEVQPQANWSDNETHGAPTTAVMSNKHAAGNEVNLVHFGEVIASLRPMLKRYCLHEVNYIVDGAGATADVLGNCTLERTLMPYNTGYSPIQADVLGVTVANTGEYVPGYTPFISYTAWAFAGWRGGARYMFDPTLHIENDNVTNQSNNANVVSWLLGRVPLGDGKIRNRIRSFSTGSAVDGSLAAELLRYFSKISGFSGINVFNTRVNPQHTFEVPYLDVLRFRPSRKYTNFQSPEQPGFLLNSTFIAAQAQGPLVPALYVAAAEDFNPMFYIGPPRLYKYSYPDPEVN